VTVGVLPQRVPRAHTALPRARVARTVVPTTSTVRPVPTHAKPARMDSRPAVALKPHAPSVMYAPLAQHALQDLCRRAHRASLPRPAVRRARSAATTKSTPTQARVFAKRAPSVCSRRVAPRIRAPRAPSVRRVAVVRMDRVSRHRAWRESTRRQDNRRAQDVGTTTNTRRREAYPRARCAQWVASQTAAPRRRARDARRVRQEASAMERTP
jgi:hypothetical protein